MTFDLTQYYDINTHQFTSTYSKINILRYLHSEIPDILSCINANLQQKDNLKYLNELRKVEIYLDLTTVKLSSYQTSISDILKACRESSIPSAKGFVDRNKKISKNNNSKDEIRIRGELEKLLGDLKKYTKESKEAKDLISRIKTYLVRKYIAGEYIEKGYGKIVLYLAVIGKSHTISENALLQTFVHELFHAYHFIATNRKFISSWKYNCFQKSTVKEGLATFIEIEYGRVGEYSTLSDNREKFLEGISIRDYPYAAYNLLIKSHRFSNNNFAHMFYTSLKDIGEAYNLLLYKQISIDNNNNIDFDNIYRFDVEKERDEQDAIDASRKRRLHLGSNHDDFYRNIDELDIRRIFEYIESYKNRNNYEENSSSSYNLQRTNMLGLITKENVVDNLSKKTEKFPDVLIRKMNERKMSDPECYKKANITRGTFNKIVNGKVRPSKENVALLALSLKLNTEEYDEFIFKAGYARSNDFDNPLNIVGYSIDNKEYDIGNIDEVVSQIRGKGLIYYGE